ncbi:SlyX family protein [Rhizobium puerariae]|uniref:Protein SlyX homolog n=1 Tax=Rhizobium puerariae TaxID=1585791 RepID=A0ABV6ALP6_9HYPH
MTDEERLVKLEELAAHQAKVIEELSDQLAGQWKVLDQTRIKLDRLTERFLELEETSREAAPVTRPPHY